MKEKLEILEKEALAQSAISSRAPADFTPAVDHPLPGNPASRRESRHGITDHPSRAAADDSGDLAVGGDLAERDCANNRVNFFIPGDIRISHFSNLTGLDEEIKLLKGISLFKDLDDHATSLRT